MPITLAGIDLLDRLFCFTLSELHVAFPPPPNRLEEERAPGGRQAKNRPIEQREQLEKRVETLASGGGLEDADLAQKLQDLEARKARQLDRQTVEALRELYHFPADVLRRILRDHDAPVVMIKAQLELVIEDLLAAGAIVCEEILERLDPLKAHGEQRVYLYQVSALEVERLEAIPTMDAAIWRAGLPTLTRVAHPEDPAGEHVFKLVHTRVWSENVETGLRQTTEVSHEQRGLDFLRVQAATGIAQIRVQLMKAGAETKIQDELEQVRNEIGKLADIKAFDPVPFDSLVRQWLRQPPPELVIGSWKVWTGPKDFVFQRGSPDSFDAPPMFFASTRPAFLSGTWTCKNGGKLQIRLDADENYVELGGKCHEDQLVELLDRIARQAAPLPGPSPGPPPPPPGPSPPPDGSGTLPSPGPEAPRTDSDLTFLKWVLLVVSMAMQKPTATPTKPDKLQYKFKYALGGLVVGTVFMICGVVLLLSGVVGRTNFTATVLGAQTNLTDAQTGLVFAVLGLLVISITRFSTK